MNSTPRPLRRGALVAASLSLFTLAGCPHPHEANTIGSPGIVAAVDAFYGGLAALDAGDDAEAEKRLTLLTTELLPDDPVGWADLGILQMRTSRADVAAAAFAKAQDLAAKLTTPNAVALRAQIGALIGQNDAARGQLASAIDHLRSAAKLAPDDPRIRWSLASAVDQNGGPDADRDYAAAITEVAKLRPDNLAVTVEAARVAARTGDAAGLADGVAKIDARRAADWPAGTSDFLAQMLAAAKPGGNIRDAVPALIRLKNTLAQVPAFRANLAELQGPAQQTGNPIRALATIAMPLTQPAAPDTGLRYTLSPDTDALTAGLPARTNLLPVDLTFSFRQDRVAADKNGLRIYRASDSGAFTDVTASAKLPPAITSAAYHRVHAADIEADGDLDLVAIPRVGEVTVLRNNGDGTLTPTHPFPGLHDVTSAFVWADIEGIGIADAVFVNQADAALRIFSNERSGQFRELVPPRIPGPVAAITTGDFNGDGMLDLVVWTMEGQIFCVSHGVGDSWTVTPLARTVAKPRPGARIFATDLDNNGAVDLVASAEGAATEIFLFAAPGTPPVSVAGPLLTLTDLATADLNGLVELRGVDKSGALAVARATSTRSYNYLTVRPRAQKLTRANGGDQRINSFGVGGLLQVRTGLNVTTVPMDGPSVHVGLGVANHADIVRIIWPNGQPQVEFNAKGDQDFTAEQRLKGSCPFLYSWNGREMAFVTDIIWRSPLGLKINGETTIAANQTEDWVKIRADQLVPRDGVYDLRITADLWETHYFDRITLMTVDHPADTQIWVDERFSPNAPTLDVYITRPPRPIARAVTDTGLDVRCLLAHRDGRYLDDFGRGPYQGVTRDHFLEIGLPDYLLVGRPIYLLCNGWLHPTDASLNVAMAQAGIRPRGLSIETRDAQGAWCTVREDLGFPAGKLKTIVLRVDDLWPDGQAIDRRLRLRTNLEIYWGQITWAEGIEDAPVARQLLDAASATLRHRGIGAVRAADPSSPELPVAYDAIATTGPYWRDLAGYHTRHGDILPLVAATDDRYAILNAGDEIRLTFPVPPPPRTGWTRDYVFIADGWVKDGDFNTTWGSTVLPLPHHAALDYPTAPGSLEDDPVYQRHSGDWETYHTRYVAPDSFRSGLAWGVMTW